MRKTEGIGRLSRARRVKRGASLAVAIGMAGLVPFAGPASAVAFSNTTPITVAQPQGSIQTAGVPYPSNITVSGLSGTVTDVNVTLCGLRATFPSDVDLMLVSPSGTNAVIMSDVGGDGDNDTPVATNINVTIDDAAANPLPKDTALTAGTFRPMDDDADEFDPDLMNTDVFFPPAPNPADRMGVYRPSNGFWFWRTDSNNVELSSFNGNNPNGTWSLYWMDDVAAGTDDGEVQTPTVSCGWSIDVTAGGGGAPRTGTVEQFGTTGDIPVPGDYDGNGSLDTAVFRPSTGTWFVLGGPSVQFGTSGDVPVPGDYDGDGDTDIAVFRPSSGQWFILGGNPGVVNFGAPGDVPVPADYDGDDDTEIAVFRPSTGFWFFHGAQAPVPAAVQFGGPGDIPVPGDYLRNGTADIGVFRPSTGVWFIQGVATFVFGTNGDMPVPYDYNSDGFTEAAVFRPSTGTWFIQGGGVIPFGTTGDVAVTLPPAIKMLYFP